MTHRHKLTGHKLRQIETRVDGTGLFEDAAGRVICSMTMVESDRDNDMRPVLRPRANDASWPIRRVAA